MRNSGGRARNKVLPSPRWFLSLRTTALVLLSSICSLQAISKGWPPLSLLHSNHPLQPLPFKARWVLGANTEAQVYQGHWGNAISRQNNWKETLDRLGWRPAEIFPFGSTTSWSIIFWAEVKDLCTCDGRRAWRRTWKDPRCWPGVWGWCIWESSLQHHPSHGSTIPSHLPRGSSSGQGSRGSGCSSSNTEDSIGTSTPRLAGAEGGLPEWWRSLSASLQGRHQQQAK